MKFIKIFSLGEIFREDLYKQLVNLDQKEFPNCNWEFKDNREWWIALDGEKIIAYCGSSYIEGIAFFNRAWVHPNYRGKGLQIRMIKLRCRAAKKKGFNTIITYTVYDNHYSANNLIKCGFLIHNPQYAYVGREVLYFKKVL